MALIEAKIGHETSASAILYRDASVYTSSLAASTIAETLDEDGSILKERRDVAAFRALFEGRANAVLKALTEPKEQVK